jgi:hypothetical protein
MGSHCVDGCDRRYALIDRYSPGPTRLTSFSELRCDSIDPTCFRASPRMAGRQPGWERGGAQRLAARTAHGS